MRNILFMLIMLSMMTMANGANAFWRSATSPSATGFGYSSTSIHTACSIAINESVIRTPYWQSCSVTGSGV